MMNYKKELRFKRDIKDKIREQETPSKQVMFLPFYGIPNKSNPIFIPKRKKKK